MADDNKTLELRIRVAADEALRAVASLKGEMASLSGEFKRLSESDGAAIKKTFEETRAAAERAAASMKLFGVSSGELRRAQAQLKAAAVDLSARGLNPQGEEVRKLVEEYQRLGKEADDLDRAAGKNINSFRDLKNALGSLAQVAALTKALGVVKDMGAFALSTADAFQTARNQFGVLLGDMEAGAGLFNEIKAFNDKTPFSLDTLTQATNVLLAAKVPLADLQSQLTKLGDLSQGNAQKFESYANAFGKVAAKGRADMEILNAYVYQGLPILGALGKRFGVLEDEIYEMVSQGKISFKDFSAALDDLAAEGGDYFDNMRLGSRSMIAMQEGVKEAINTLAASFGEMLLPTAIEVAQALIDITNVINESPIAKGVFAGALAAITGYLAAMAIKAGVAFAAQMKLNLAIGALHPLVAAATVAVGIAAAGYTMYASKLQKAKREAEDFAWEQRKQKDAVDEAAAALERYKQAVGDMSFDELRQQLRELNDEVYQYGGVPSLKEWQADMERLDAAQRAYAQRRNKFIDTLFSATQAGKIAKVNEQLALVQQFLRDADLTSLQETVLRQTADSLNASLDQLIGKAKESGDKADDMAAKWKEAWADVWKQFQAEQSLDLFAGVELERGKKLADAYKNYVRDGNKETIDQVNAYYDAERSKVVEQLADQEKRLALELTETRIDDLEYELQEALKNIDILEAQRVIAAAGSEEEIAAIRKWYAAAEEETIAKFRKNIARTRFDEQRENLLDWERNVAATWDRWLWKLNDLEIKAVVILADLIAEFEALSASAALGGFEEFGRALAETEDFTKSAERAFAAMGQQILQQLPLLFLQAGLQLVANGQWPLGLGFIAAAGSAALVSGFVDGTVARAKEDAGKEARENAQGGVYDAYGRAAREYAAGGAFTNRVVSEPTYFRHGGGLGLMGEAGPEAIVPLARGGDGRLGISAFGGQGAAAAVYVIVENHTNEEARVEESSDGSDNQIRRIVIGAVKQSISSGEMDQPLSSRFGLRARGV
jgi:tape measure domain-containing protein